MGKEGTPLQMDMFSGELGARTAEANRDVFPARNRPVWCEPQSPHAALAQHAVAADSRRPAHRGGNRAGPAAGS